MRKKYCGTGYSTVGLKRGDAQKPCRRSCYQSLKIPIRTTTNVPRSEPRSVLGAAQLGCSLGLGRLGLCFALHRIRLGALDRRRLDAGGNFGARGVGRVSFASMQRTRPRHRARHQHLLAAALMAEIAIGEAHAGDGAAEAALVPLVEIEAGLEGNALDRCAHGLAADLQ